MKNILHIAADPNPWVLDDAQLESVAEQIAQAGGPVTLPVIAPLKGSLVLSRSAASVALLPPPGGVGWTPGYIHLPAPGLYVPSPSTPASHVTAYALPPPADLTKLGQDIVAAMTEGTRLTVEISDGLLTGQLFLNGATLPFAVLCPAS